MNCVKIFLYLLLISLHVNAVEIDEKSTQFGLLSHASVFIDETGTLSKEEIESHLFTKNSQEVLSLGFVPEKTLWIRFELSNSTDKRLHKIIEYDNPEVEALSFFYEGREFHASMLHVDKSRIGLHPTLEITLAPHESKTLTISAHSEMTSLMAKLLLWEREDFIRSDAAHKTALLIFFAAIGVLLMYNFFILVFTRDKAYMYYVIYLASSMLFLSLNYGVVQYYLFSDAWTALLTKASMAVASMVGISIILFSREFLHTWYFKRIDTVLKAYVVLLALLSLLSYDNWVFDMNVSVVMLPLIFIIFVGIYAWMRGQRQAKYYVFGWAAVQISLTLVALKYLGVFDVTLQMKYLVEVAFVIEAVFFSIALAHRFKLIAEQKTEADRKLIDFQHKEQEKLQNMVAEKTEELRNSLEEKELLYRELNHRVKNNLAMILSLIKLQISRSNNEETLSNLESTKNRIHSISHLYEVLNLQGNATKIDTHEYFRNIVKMIMINFDKEITIECDITVNLNIQELIYCGLILNELVTNAYKYAFEKSGTLSISLKKDEDMTRLHVKDDGIGFNDKNNQSLGLEIVRTLAKKQLRGTLDIDSQSGTEVTIQWREHE
ncbi:MAG: 7TM diverse intracellular signaling domain-containing protein [Campylobacterota bacterium]|nr:7TM diverse intracellular signaling domain-containing protein [Campylobacterota bacterium]